MPMYLLYGHADAVANNVGDFFSSLFVKPVIFLYPLIPICVVVVGVVASTAVVFLRFVC